VVAQHRGRFFHGAAPAPVGHAGLARGLGLPGHPAGRHDARPVGRLADPAAALFEVLHPAGLAGVHPGGFRAVGTAGAGRAGAARPARRAGRIGDGAGRAGLSPGLWGPGPALSGACRASGAGLGLAAGVCGHLRHVGLVLRPHLYHQYHVLARHRLQGRLGRRGPAGHPAGMTAEPGRFFGWRVVAGRLTPALSF